MQARSAGLEFITFDNDDNNETSHGKKQLETQDNEIPNMEDKEDPKLDYEKDNSELSVLQINNGEGGDVGRDSGDGDDDEKKEAGKEDPSVMFGMVEARKTGISKKGTEIRFRGMDLHENTATVRVTSLNFTVQCGRCKNREEMPNVKEKYGELTAHFYHLPCYLYFYSGQGELGNILKFTLITFSIFSNFGILAFTPWGGGGCFTPKHNHRL